LSQEPAAQLHSAHLRATSSHLSPYIPEEDQTLHSPSGHSIVNLDLLASNIGVPSPQYQQKAIP